MKNLIFKLLILFALYKCGYRVGVDNTKHEIKDRAIALTVNPNQENKAIITSAFEYALYGSNKKQRFLKEIKHIATNDSLMLHYRNRPSVDKLLKKNKY